MNKISFTFFTFIILLSALLSCSYEETAVFKPVYISYEDMRRFSIITADETDTTEEEITAAGKIYYYEPYLLINELKKGIHFYDNTDPKNPEYLGMLELPGNVDMAIKDDVLYADNYIDLVAFDISELPDLSKIIVLKRIEKSLYYNPVSLVREERETLPVYYEKIDSSKGVVVSWKRTVETKVAASMDLMPLGGTSADMAASKGSAGGVGQGGSMAKFTIYDDYLYAVVSEQALQIFNIKNVKEPKEFANIPIGRNIETIFPYSDYLFIGSEHGMYIYEVKENPGNPKYVSELIHTRSYDPVVASGNYAYVTLRAGAGWANSRNELLIIDISDITNPELKDQVAMQGPYGLGVLDDNLFICDGKAGLKLYEILEHNEEEKQTSFVKFIKQLGNDETYDVIPVSNELIIVTGPEILTQYSLEENVLEKLSEITIRK
jgi:hypothetical protein